MTTLRIVGILLLFVCSSVSPRKSKVHKFHFRHKTQAFPASSFQIYSRSYRKCLSVSYISVYKYFRGVHLTRRLHISLKSCDVYSKGQRWRWTNNGQLKSIDARQCLVASTRGRRIKVVMKRCDSRNDLKWSCDGSRLKLKNTHKYLVPYPSGDYRSHDVVVRSRVTRSSQWVRYRTSQNICGSTATVPPTPTSIVTKVVENDKWFHIYSSSLKLCLAVRDKSRFPQYLRPPPFELVTCKQSCPRQLWQWTSNSQLQSKHSKACLTVTVLSGVTLRSCNFPRTRFLQQHWSCVGNWLRIGSSMKYLVPAVYSGLPFGYTVLMNVNDRRNHKWSKLESRESICDTAATVPPTPTSLVTKVVENDKWFHIYSSSLKLCLAVRDKSRFPQYPRPPPFELVTCKQSCPRQLWQWTSNSQLQSKYNKACLTFSYLSGVTLRLCNSPRARFLQQRWSCVGKWLRMGSSSKYLVPAMYSGLPFGYTVFLKVNGLRNHEWSKLENGKPICDTDKTTVTPPVRSTDNLLTPPLPPTGTLKPPPLPPTKTLKPPSLPPTGTLKPPPRPPTETLKPPPLPPTGTLTTPPLPPTGTLIPPPFPPIGTLIPPPFPPTGTLKPPPFPKTTKSPPPEGNKLIKCGTKGRVAAVVNGTAAAAGSWPWQVGIKTCAHCNITCGGTLINDEWVVTAAHCVSSWFPEDLYIVLGEVDQSKKSENEQWFKGKRIISHEEYGVNAPYDKDIALIQLDKYAVFNDHVRPLCLPKKEKVLSDSDLCTVTGFGRVSQYGPKSPRLLQANVKVVLLKTCVKSYASIPNRRQVTANMVCAGYERGGTDACHGDSGGPLTCFDFSNFKFFLGGVVSWGVGCARPNLYGVYTNTPVFAPWVEKKLAAFGY